MFAIVKSGGRQFMARLGTVLELEKLSGKVGDKLELEVMFTGANVKGKVVGEILNQGKGDKVIVFKKRRRHMYRRKQGHRQHLTTIQIVEIGGKQIEEKNKRKIITRTAPLKLTPEQKKEKAQRAAKRASEAKLKKAMSDEAAKPAAKPAKKSGDKAAAKAAKKAPPGPNVAKPEAKHNIKNQNLGTAKSAAPRKTAPSSGNKG